MIPASVSNDAVVCVCVGVCVRMHQCDENEDIILHSYFRAVYKNSLTLPWVAANPPKGQLCFVHSARQLTAVGSQNFWD